MFPGFICQWRFRRIQQLLIVSQKNTEILESTFKESDIVLGTLLYRKFIGEAKLKPLFISKLNTVCQILLVLLVMLSQVFNFNELVVDSIFWLVVVTTIMSGYAYINEWGRRAWYILKGKEVS